MKKGSVIGLLVAAGLFLSGNSNFEVGRLNLYVERMDRAIGQGRGQEACGVVDAGVRFTLRDTRTGLREINGGRDEMCRYFEEQSHYYTTSPIADYWSNVDFEVSRDYFRWRTVHVSFVQLHDVELHPERTRTRHIARKKLTLVKSGDTFRIKDYEINLSND